MIVFLYRKRIFINMSYNERGFERPPIFIVVECMKDSNWLHIFPTKIELNTRRFCPALFETMGDLIVDLIKVFDLHQKLDMNNIKIYHKRCNKRVAEITHLNEFRNADLYELVIENNI